MAADKFIGRLTFSGCAVRDQAGARMPPWSLFRCGNSRIDTTACFPKIERPDDESGFAVHTRAMSLGRARAEGRLQVDDGVGTPVRGPPTWVAKNPTVLRHSTQTRCERVPGAMSDDFQLGNVFKVALIIGAVVLALGLIGIWIT